LSTEVARATSAEAVLTSDLSSEVSARIADVDAEESRATAAELVLTNDLSSEVSNRIADVDAEESRATAAELVLTNNLSTEVSNRIADVDAEQARAESAEAVLTADLSSEMSARIADVDAEESRAMAAEDLLDGDLRSEMMNRQIAVDAEASYRVSGDLSLQNQIDFITSNVDAAAIDSLTEIVSAFQSADGDINNAITTLADAAGANLSTEVARAESAEAVLTADLSSEVSNRESADTSLAVALSIEVSKRNDLGQSVYSEVSNRTADVDAEESRAIAAEGVLTSDLSSEVANREAAISAEESMRVEADASIAAELSSDIAGLADVDGTTIVLNGDTNQIELADEVAAGAGGNRTFLGEIDIKTILKVGGVDVMAEISSEIARAEAAEASIAEELSTEVSYLIANTDLGSIDSFAEIVSELSNEIARAESVEGSIETSVNNLSTNTEMYVDDNRPTMLGFKQDPDGAVSAFTCNVEIETQIVFLNGIMQLEDQDYTIASVAGAKGAMNTEVTFASAPAATDRINIYGVSNKIRPFLGIN